MNGQFNIWNKWDPLKTVMLGDCYAPEFFRDIKNPRIRAALDRIATESKEDLEIYEKILKDFGCNVLRPKIDKNKSIMDYIDLQGKLNHYVPRAPLQPRDSSLIIGNRVFITNIHDHAAIGKCIFEYANNKNDIKILQSKKGKISAACFTFIGDDLYVDKHSMNKIDDEYVSKIKSHLLYNNIRINNLRIGGHNDATFALLGPGVILSLEKIQNYSETFPGWDVCYLPNQSWDLVDDFLKLKDKINGKWWVPGEEENDEFTYFVETWLQDWVGYVEETVFDVNVLMLDEHHVCVTNYNKSAFDFFKKYKIEPVIVPWRHRYFWDGGLHCITLDLYRESSRQNYFPERKQPIIDLGFD